LRHDRGHSAIPSPNSSAGGGQKLLGCEWESKDSKRDEHLNILHSQSINELTDKRVAEDGHNTLGDQGRGRVRGPVSANRGDINAAFEGQN